MAFAEELDRLQQELARSEQGQGRLARENAKLEGQMKESAARLKRAEKLLAERDAELEEARRKFSSLSSVAGNLPVVEQELKDERARAGLLEQRIAEAEAKLAAAEEAVESSTAASRQAESEAHLLSEQLDAHHELVGALGTAVGAFRVIVAKVDFLGAVEVV